MKRSPDCDLEIRTSPPTNVGAIQARDPAPVAAISKSRATRPGDDGGASAVVAFNNSDNSQRMTLPVGEKIGAHDGCEFEEPLANGQRLHVSGGQLHVELPPNGLRVFLRV